MNYTPSEPDSSIGRVTPPATLLMGEPGNGKTFSIATMLAHPYVEKLFYIFTDPGGDESLIDALQHYDQDIANVHWAYVPPASEGWDTLEELATKVNRMDYKALADLKQGINKQDHRQMYKLIEVFGSFTCQRTGENFGPVDQFPNTWAVAFDSLTGLNKIAKDSTVGAKPTLHQGEWGVAMNMEEVFIRKFCADIKCPRVMVGHLDKQMDEITGRQLLQISLLGNKLAPNIPSLFSDAIYAYRDEDKFLWSTTDNRISLKARNLPLSDKIPADFRPVLDKWRQRTEFAKSKG